MSYLRIMFVLALCCLSSLLGEEKDFLDPVSETEISKEALTTPEEDDKLSRHARQSFSFSTFQPFAPNAQPRQSTESGSTVGISFQRIRMGPEDSAEAPQRQPPPVQSSQFRSTPSQGTQDIARPRLTLNDLNFKGFEFSPAFSANTIQPAFAANTVQPPTTFADFRNRFRNIQSFQTATEPSRSRNVQPTPSSSPITRSQFPNFQDGQVVTEPPRSRSTNFNLPPNIDPRKRNRNQQSRVQGNQQFLGNEPKLSNSRAFQLNSIRQDQADSEKSSNRRMRKRLKIVTRVPVTRAPAGQFRLSTNSLSFQTRVPITRAPASQFRQSTDLSNGLSLQTQVPVTRAPAGQFRQSTDLSNGLAFQPKNVIQESVRSFDELVGLDDDYRDDLLIQNCLKEAEKHAKEIEELENRTALHIDYAQGKQLEIVTLELNLESLKNQSKVEKEKTSSLENNVQNLTVLIETKNKAISTLKGDITKLEETFEKEELKKHETIQDLNEKLETTTIELAKSKILLDETAKENNVKSEELDEAMSKIEKFKKEKKNLLRIVQQLAEIGNPSLNFNTFSIGSDQEEYEDYEEEVQDYEQEVQDYESEDIIVEDEAVEDEASEPDGSGDLIET